MKIERYACPECEKETGYAHIYEHKAPRLLKHSLASASSVADIEGFYNTLRPHSALGWLAPNRFEANLNLSAA